MGDAKWVSPEDMMRGVGKGEVKDERSPCSCGKLRTQA